MEQNLPVEEIEELAETDAGKALRRTREFYGKTLGDIERALHIRGSQLDAIERGDVSVLPGRVYATGFVRSYAEYLGLDGSKIVSLYKEQYMDGEARATLSFPVPASEMKTPTVWLVALTLVLSVAFMLIWHSYNKPNRSIVRDVVPLPAHIKNHVNEVLVDVLDIPLQVVGDTVDVSGNDGIGVENMGGIQRTGIILKIIGDSWVEIKDGDGGILVSRVLETGDEYFVPDNPGLSMSLGNAGNVELIVEGRVLKPLGGDGSVRREIPLNTTYLKTLEFK